MSGDASTMEHKDVKTLSPTEQRVYSELYSKRVITTIDVRRILGDPHKTADYISNLRDKGYLMKIRKGLYAIVPPNLVGKGFNPDKYLVGSRLKQDSFLSYHTALELHGLAQSAFSTVYITIGDRSGSFSYQGMEYRFTSTKHLFGKMSMNYQGQQVMVSDRERTVLDCIRRVRYAGGLEELVKSISNVPSFDFEKILDYLERFGERSLYHKTGFILESLGARVPPEFLQALHSEVGKRVYYLDEEKRSVLNRKWNLMVPRTFEELVKGA